MAVDLLLLESHPGCDRFWVAAKEVEFHEIGPQQFQCKSARRAFLYPNRRQHHRRCSRIATSERFDPHFRLLDLLLTLPRGRQHMPVLHLFLVVLGTIHGNLGHAIVDDFLLLT